MASNRWDENVPSGSSAINLGDDDIRSHVTSIRIGLDDEHHWSSTLGDANRGTHRYGSARGWMDAQSNLSASGTSYVGRLYITSDTSRLFAVPDSGCTMFLGGSAVLEHGTAPSQNTRYVIQTGTVTTAADDAMNTVTFDPVFDASPVVTLTSKQTENSLNNPIIASIQSLSKETVQIITVTGSGASALAVPVHYHAVGQITF